MRVCNLYFKQQQKYIYVQQNGINTGRCSAKMKIGCTQYINPVTRLHTGMLCLRMGANRS